MKTAQGDVAGALAALDRALAEPHGYVRMCVDEGAPMVEWLRQAQAASNSAPAYVALLLAACGTRVAGCAG
jgi:hypothetical protein